MMHCKKRLAVFPSPAWMSLSKLALARNNLINSRLERVWLVTSRLGTGKPLIFFTVSLMSIFLVTFTYHIMYIKREDM
jgi:hypothetical protein